ncbi:MAG: uroporphyrinogen-III synthase [Nitrospiraceae bacterium]
MPQSPDHQIIKSNFAGLAVAAFESRMAAEMARLIERYGGRPLVAPSMREIPLQNHTEVLEFGEQLLNGHYDMVILLTGIGTRTMVEALQTRHSLASIKAALGRATLVARGPKPIAALKELGLTAAIAVPEPNTWRDIVSTLDARHSVAGGLRIAVQEYGVSNNDLLEALRERGAQVTQVPVYRWALPEDIAPLISVIDAWLAGEVDVVLITNAVQIDHIMRLLTQDSRFKGGTNRLRDAAGQMIVASVGPTASERLRYHGLPVDLEPSHPKMGALVKETSERAHALLQRKRPRP